MVWLSGFLNNQHEVHELIEPQKQCQCWCFFGILGNPYEKDFYGYVMSVYHKPRPPLKFSLILRLARNKGTFLGGNWSLVIVFWHVPPLVRKTKKFPQTISDFYHSMRTAALPHWLVPLFFLGYQLLSVGHHVGFPTWPICGLNSHSQNLQ